MDEHPKGKALHALCTGHVWLAMVHSAQQTPDAVTVAYIPHQQVCKSSYKWWKRGWAWSVCIIGCLFVVCWLVEALLLQVHLMGQYSFAHWRMSSSSVTLPADWPGTGTVITHASCMAAGVGRAFSHFCLSVHALKGKRLELSTPNLVHIYSIVVAQHALTQMSKVKVTWLWKPSRSHGCYWCVLQWPCAAAAAGCHNIWVLCVVWCTELDTKEEKYFKSFL